MVLLLALIIFGAAGVWSAYGKERESASLRLQSQAALRDLTLQEAQLRQNIVTLQSARGKEAALREQYAVGQKGEQLIVIVDPATTTPIATSTSLIQRIEDAFSWW